MILTCYPQHHIAVSICSKLSLTLRWSSKRIWKPPKINELGYFSEGKKCLVRFATHMLFYLNWQNTLLLCFSYKQNVSYTKKIEEHRFFFCFGYSICYTQSAEPLIRLLYYTLNMNPFFTVGRDWTNFT